MASQVSKKCTKCKEDKDLSQPQDLKSNKKYGKKSQCKKCTQAYRTALYFSNEEFRQKTIKYASVRNRERKYNISEINYNNLLKNQNNCCAICNITLDKSKFGLIGQVDHCHNTGKIRGILCSQCNTGIGNLKHDTDIIKSAIKYLES